MKKIIWILLIITIAIGIYLFTSQDKRAQIEPIHSEMEADVSETEAMQNSDNGSMVEGDNMITDDMEMPDEMPRQEIDPAMEEHMGMFTDYSPELLANAEAGDVVLFFHAPWCPTCRTLANDINKNLSSIPKGVTILKVDYDTESELKQKYGVTYQHTLVQVDSDGNMITKWSGSMSLASFLQNIK